MNESIKYSEQMHDIFSELGLPTEENIVNYSVPVQREVTEPVDRASAQCKMSCEWYETRHINKSCQECLFYTTNWSAEQEEQFIAWEGEQGG